MNSIAYRAAKEHGLSLWSKRGLLARIIIKAAAATASFFAILWAGAAVSCLHAWLFARLLHLLDLAHHARHAEVVPTWQRSTLPGIGVAVAAH